MWRSEERSAVSVWGCNLLRKNNMGREDKKNTCETCGKCALCVHTYQGCECGLTDNPVLDTQPACIDFIAEAEEVDYE